MSASAPAETTPQVTDQELDPVQPVPPEQEFQTSNPGQLGQTRTHDNPPVAGVTQAEALDARRKREEGPKIDFGTSLGDIVHHAFFIPEGGSEPEIAQISPTQINIHYPDDGSMVVVRIEARQGAWGGVSAIGLNDAGKERAQRHFDAQKKIMDDRRKTAAEAAKQESHDDATARRESKPESVEEPANV